MNRSFSLRRADFQRAWDDGKAWSNSLVILRVRANGMDCSRFGFVVGKRVGKATVRNRVKRLMREAIRRRSMGIAPGWDVILISRKGAEQADSEGVDSAVEVLLRRAQLLETH